MGTTIQYIDRASFLGKIVLNCVVIEAIEEAQSTFFDVT